MTFLELTERARQRTCTFLKEYEKARNVEGNKVYLESALRDSSGNIVCAPDGLMLPLRVDLAVLSGSGELKTEYAESSTLYLREPASAQWGEQLEIEIQSLCWNSARFRLQPVTVPHNWEGLREWFIRWFDIDDEKPLNADGLYGVVHFLSDPEIEPNGIRFDVDFGSATVMAFGEFFDELTKLGFTHCTVGTSADPGELDSHA